MNFPINEASWRGLSPSGLAAFEESIFNHYRESGFPYYALTPDEVRGEFIKASKYLAKTELIKDDVISQSMHGLSSCWTFFPHHNSVRCGAMKTPMEAFLDDDSFRKIIKKRLSFGTYLSDSGIRKTLKIASGMQGVSNFRPTAASAIYNRYGGGAVYDMSSGFGGRLFGAMLTPSVTSYIGTDPSTENHAGVSKLHRVLEPLAKTKVTLHNLGSELYIPEEASLDICFTSPPYFDTEKYSDESTQSYLKYPDKNNWFNDFLLATMANCQIGLKIGGYLIVNIANVKSYPTLEKDFLLAMFKNSKFRHIETLKYSLSAICKGGFKYEPVFVFKRIN